MSRKVTLGGNHRLGTGNKMKVELHAYERSTHNMGYIWRSTMSAGTLVPFLKEVGLPGDTFDIDLDCDVKTHPTIGPLFGSYKVQLDLFVAPIRLYNGLLHNNTLNIGRNMSQAKLPLIRLIAKPNLSPAEPADPENAQINPSCVLAYLGIKGVGSTATEQQRDFNAVPLLAYYDIYKNYYANRQEGVGAVIHTAQPEIDDAVTGITVNGTPLSELPTSGNFSITPGSVFVITHTGLTVTIPELLNQLVLVRDDNTTLRFAQLLQVVGTTGTTITANYVFGGFGTIEAKGWRYISATDINQNRPEVFTFPLTNFDQMRNLLMINLSTTAYLINTTPVTPYNELYSESVDGRPNMMNSQEGLAIKTYQADLFNAWLDTDWIDGTNGITEVTAVDTSGGSFTIDQLNLSQKVYKMLNRIAVSGGSYDDWQVAVYDHEIFGKAETPVYQGSLIKELVFQEVVSNAQSSDQPLGTLAGKGIMSKKHKGGKIHVKINEAAYLMGIVSLTPRIDYSSGNHWDVNLRSLDDLHKPALDEIGFQEDITEYRAWWDTNWVTDEWVQKSAGKQPAWIYYMTNVNRTYGNFAVVSNEMFMTLNRRYEGAESGFIADLTTYIDPSKFNFIFAETALDAQNFWVQIGVDMIVRRKMSAKIMPNL